MLARNAPLKIHCFEGGEGPYSAYRSGLEVGGNCVIQGLACKVYSGFRVGGLRSVLFLDMGVPPPTSKRSNHVGSCAGHQENPAILRPASHSLLPLRKEREREREGEGQPSAFIQWHSSLAQSDKEKDMEIQELQPPLIGLDGPLKCEYCCIVD